MDYLDFAGRIRALDTDSAHHQGKKTGAAVGGMVVGLCALLAVNITGLFTGVSLPLSPLSLGVSAAAGIPGVTAMLLLNLIFY